MGSRSLFGGLFDERVGTAEIDPRGLAGELLGVEVEAVEGAAATRVAQFTAGRICARTALGAVGLDAPAPIARGADRAPVWPPGFVGSITHTRSWCAAAAAPASRFRALGIDLEPDTPLRERLMGRICTPEEQHWIAEQAEPGLMAKVIFSAKESVYKCQYTITREFLGFQGAFLELDDGLFRAVLRQPVGCLDEGYEILGRYAIESGFVATACSIEAS